MRAGLKKAAYTAQNPVRLGLVKAAEEWPYVWRTADENDFDM